MNASLSNVTRSGLLAGILLLTACGGESPAPAPATTEPAAVATSSAPTPAPETPAAAASEADAFLARVAQHCGQAFAGRITANRPPEGEAPVANDPFEGKTLVMHVRECGEREIRIPFHVGEDHSRTWVLTRTESGLRLKHDHRHADGSHDAVTMYGGDTAEPGSEQRQAFPVDAESIALFEREGLSASVSNTWAMEVEPGQRFLYELARPSGRLFQVEFDLSTPVETPPTPWGHPELD